VLAGKWQIRQIFTRILSLDECTSPKSTNHIDELALLQPIAASEIDPLVILRHSAGEADAF
jgi:hypothetical protein